MLPLLQKVEKIFIKLVSSKVIIASITILLTQIEIWVKGKLEILMDLWITFNLTISSKQSTMSNSYKDYLEINQWSDCFDNSND